MDLVHVFVLSWNGNMDNYIVHGVYSKTQSFVEHLS